MKIPQYKTSNFYLSAYLICKDLELIGIDREDPKRSVFIFSDSPRREEMVNQYNFGKDAWVDARRFATAIKDLKGKLYSHY